MATVTQTETLVVLDPKVSPERADPSRAPRLSSLKGTTAGLLDNGKPNSDVLLRRLGEMLVTRYGVAKVHMVRKSDSSTVAEADVLADLIRHSHFVVAGVGD